MSEVINLMNNVLDKLIGSWDGGVANLPTYPCAECGQPTIWKPDCHECSIKKEQVNE